MTALNGQLALSPQGGYVNPRVTSALRSIDPAWIGWPSGQADLGIAPAATLVRGTSAQPRYAINGVLAQSYFDDYYNRIHVLPQQLDLGNLITAQRRTVEVWNAYTGTSQTLNSVASLNADGITATPPAALPLAFAPLQSRLWTIAVSNAGSPVINATLSWLFAGLAAVDVQVTGDRLVAWVFVPNWANPVAESLIWLTDIQQALDGSEYREPVRDTPRRQWEFDVLAQGQDRQQMEAVLYDWTGRNWALPVWTDVSYLAAPLAAGSLVVPADTPDRDFAVGSLMMLWTDAQHYELAEVSAVGASSLMLATVTVNAWPAQTRLYPCRLSRLTDAPQLARTTDRLTQTRARFEAVEPCSWPAVAPTATYLGLPVLEDHPNEAGGLAAQLSRQLLDLDADAGLVYVDDITGLAYPTQSHAWLKAGRAARTALRSLLYWLQGKAAALWVPSWADDLSLAADVAAAATTLTVARIGLTSHLHLQPGRRHLRVELYDGSIYYRAVTAVAVIDAATEQLQIDSALGVAVTAGDVRQINWLMLCRLASDTVQLSHMHDINGLVTMTANWAGVPGEEP
ncbi:MAG: hypothetical protein ACYCZD_12750 [Rhodanobacter sp.]